MGGSGRYRWVVLAVGSVAQASTATYFLGLAAVTPALRDHFGLSLAGVGALVGAVSVGLVATLIAWGGAADRYGERVVMTAGLAGAAAALGGAAFVRDPVAAGVLLGLAGASGASVNAASGRAVLTWFPAERRGLAMAVRQTAVPVGAALAAVALPLVADRGGVPAVFLTLACTCLAAGVAVAVWVREPPGRAPRSTRTISRARTVLTDRRLQRVSLAGALLVVPQFLGSVFLVEVLHTGHGMAVATAGVLLAAMQILGGLGTARQRLVVRPRRRAGSDRCGSSPWPWPSASASPLRPSPGRRSCWPPSSSRPRRWRRAGTVSSTPPPVSSRRPGGPRPRCPCRTRPTSSGPPRRPFWVAWWPRWRAGR